MVNLLFCLGFPRGRDSRVSESLPQLRSASKTRYQRYIAFDSMRLGDKTGKLLFARDPGGSGDFSTVVGSSLLLALLQTV